MRIVSEGTVKVISHCKRRPLTHTFTVGLTSSGSIGAQTGKSLEQCVDDIKAIQEAARGVNLDIIVLCHGGPIAKPEDARFVLERCKGLHGFFGASSMERLPVEEAIANVTREFRGIAISK